MRRGSLAFRGRDSMLKALLIIHLLLTSLGCSASGSRAGLEEDAFSEALFASPPTEFGPQTRWRC